ncbi:UDP-glycosyltransferase 73B4 [Euphorbia peplus]|nr:UDP-glycosyltransferase 73B4 [Euphorbia peplus]
MEGKGLVIRGWAPQVLILEHEAVGGFVSHCGWNSTLEAITAGVKMVTWPVAAEQFYNEKLVVEILKIGVPVGAKKWAKFVRESVKREAISEAVKKLMLGEEAEQMRCRAKKYAELARKAVQNGGSSYTDFNSFIDEFRTKVFTDILREVEVVLHRIFFDPCVMQLGNILAQLLVVPSSLALGLFETLSEFGRARGIASTSFP